MEESVCVREGGVCLFRGGLVGAAVKLHCCPGAKCVFWGRSFTCVRYYRVAIIYYCGLFTCVREGTTDRVGENLKFPGNLIFQ